MEHIFEANSLTNLKIIKSKDIVQNQKLQQDRNLLIHSNYKVQRLPQLQNYCLESHIAPKCRLEANDEIFQEMKGRGDSNYFNNYQKHLKKQIITETNRLEMKTYAFH